MFMLGLRNSIFSYGKMIQVSMSKPPHSHEPVSPNVMSCVNVWEIVNVSPNAVLGDECKNVNVNEDD